MSSYNSSQWKEFRLSVIQLDGYRCQQCNRDQSEVTLQVHHKVYRPGLKAWEYATEDCITLCSGCHARAHGIIQPSFGWEYIGFEDLGDLIGTCENRNCNSSIRYSFTVFHPLWGTLEVGTVCCDNLTDSEIASNQKESKLKYESRKERFIHSKRWKIDGDKHHIKQGLFEITILEENSKCRLKINGKIGEKTMDSVADAKIYLFEIIENGILMKYFKSNNFDFGKKKKK